jgi:hypothetical protein
MGRTSNVALEINTRERLKAIGRKGQTYNEIISELLTQSGRDEILGKSSPAPSSPTKDQTASVTIDRGVHG